MGADQRTELAGGGEKRVCRDQDRHQDPQQDQCPGRAQSRGSFTFHFVRYEDCPPAAQEKAIAEAKALAEKE